MNKLWILGYEGHRVFFLFWYLTSHGENRLRRRLGAECLVHHKEHNNREQRGEHGAQEVVRATVTGDRHHLSNDVPHKVHPSNGCAERKSGHHKVGRLTGKLRGNLGDRAHFTFEREINQSLEDNPPPGQSSSTLLWEGAPPHSSRLQVHKFFSL